MTALKRNLMVSSAALLASPATVLAHAGHDHGHWSSGLVHTLFFLSVFAAVGIGNVIYQKRKQAHARQEVK